jgi:1,4-alpha-glucan branching enzyme
VARKDPKEPKKKKLSDVLHPLEKLAEAVAGSVVPEKKKRPKSEAEAVTAKEAKDRKKSATDPAPEAPKPAKRPKKSSPPDTSQQRSETPAAQTEDLSTLPTMGLPAATEPPPTAASSPAERHVFSTRVSEVSDDASDSFLTDEDIYLFAEGTHTRLYQKFGAHTRKKGGRDSTVFSVWAPNAESVSVFGDFNRWNKSANPLRPRGGSGIWEGEIEGVGKGATYKFHIVSRYNGFSVDKADPFGLMHETPPQTASVIWDLDYEWGDDEWMKVRQHRNSIHGPMTIYELHAGSWMRNVEEDRPLTYRELAGALVPYLKEMQFTHVEFLPVMEHPFYGSWGYQCTGFFAPTSRYGTPQDLMYLIDQLHQAGIGVILDWVPSHFPTDEHGLAYFDGTHLFEHADPRQGFHPDWGSLIFNYGRNEVRSFLLSSALFWLERFHADGLRVDAVASMLYLDYSRKAGEWIPNKYGGRENLEAVSFLRRLNEDCYGHDGGILTIAEESTAWPMVSRPSYIGGLGFGMKWDMGWMHDTLKYMQEDPIHRKYHHNLLTFRMMYAYTENFVLPLSHDEVVHGKGSLLNKMPGDEWQKFANLRLLYAYMYSQPGKKLLFMGGEFGQWREWNHDSSLDWHVLESPYNRGLKEWVRELNTFHRWEPAMHRQDVTPGGFEWIDCNDSEQSVVSCLRRDGDQDGAPIVAVFNFTPLVRYNYQIGVPLAGWWKEMLNSDGREYGGSGQGNMGRVEAAPVGVHGRPFSLSVTLPPLGAVFFKPEPPQVSAAEDDDR